MTWTEINIRPDESEAFHRTFHRDAKFYTDENIDQRIVEIMRDLNFKVVTAAESGMIQRDDADHLSFAHANDMILVSRDHDFLDDGQHPPHRCPGVVILDIDPITSDELADALYLLKGVVKPYRELWWNSKIMISKQGHITVWQKEHDTGKRTKTRYRLRGRVAEEWRP